MAKKKVVKQTIKQSTTMDLIQTVAPGSYTLSVAGADINGSPAPIGTATFTSESGSQSVSPIDDASAGVSVSDTSPGSIRVDASDLDPASPLTLTARLTINPATAPKAVSLTLTLK